MASCTLACDTQRLLARLITRPGLAARCASPPIGPDEHDASGDPCAQRD